MSKPTISVIMPAYNAEKYISESINSVIDQTYTNWELIIIDDGSTDNTFHIIQPFLTQDNRIKYVFQSNSGQGKARNRGLLEAKGELIAFLDADDLWITNKLDIQVEDMNNSPEVDLLFSGAKAFKGTHQNILKHLNHNNSDIYSGLDAFKVFLKGNKIPILTVLVKKEIVEAVGNFDESRHLQNVEDSHLWLKLLFENYNLKSSNKNLAFYRVHEEQSTSNKFKNTLKEINLIKDFTGRESSLDKDIFLEIKRKYFSLFVRKMSPEEKEILFSHYSDNFKIRDRIWFKFLHNKIPLRGFSIYYRYVHSILLTKSKIV
jgi:glycosyltransferase involved in cell wall biosynthesis